MPTNLENTVQLIAAGLQDEAREQLTQQRAVRTGFLRDSVEVFVQDGGDLFVVEFADYGVFVDQGSRFVNPRPFYSNLVVEGQEEGTYEDEIEEMLEDAFEEDVLDLEELFENMVN